MPSEHSSERNSALIALGILVSRVLGLLRQRLFAQYFGTSLYADAFVAALRLPNLLQNLLGEGTLSASFIPVYAELLEKDREEAGRVAGAVFGVLVALTGVLAVLGVMLAPFVVPLVLPGFEGERRAITIDLVRILFPMTGALVLSAWALGVLNSHRHFFLSYVAPAAWNVVIIGTFVTFGTFLAYEGRSLALAVGFGALAGGVVQFLVQVPSVLRLERALRVRWDPTRPGVLEVLRNAGPTILGRGVVQLSGYLDLVLASLLSVGAVAALGYAQTLYLLPVSLFGMSVAAAELPELSRQRDDASGGLRDRTNAALERVLFFVLPCAVAFLVQGDLAVAALFRTGVFGGDQTTLVYATLVGYTLGLVASTQTRLLSSALYALRDTRTPARLAIVRVVASTGLGLVLMGQFEPILGFEAGVWANVRAGALTLGAAGLAAGAGLAAWVEWALLRRALVARVGTVGVSAATMSRVGAAAAASAVIAAGVRSILPAGWHDIGVAVLVFGAAGAVYLGVAALLGVSEAARLVARVRGLSIRRKSGS